MYTASAALSDPKKARAPAETEIEITPEMIEAGLKAFEFYNEDYNSREEGIVEIFLAMYEAMKT
jgi:hypothetical protein